MFYYATAKLLIRRDATTNTPKDATKSEPSSKSMNKKKEKITYRGKRAQNKLAVQKARCEIGIEREYTNFFDDKKNWMHGNCKHFKYKTKIFDQLEAFQFEKIGKKKLIVIVPGMTFKKEELSIAKHAIFSIAYESLKWFAKFAKIKFKWHTMHLCQKPHITQQAHNSRAIRVARDWSLSINGKMLDMSSGKADWEAEAGKTGTILFDDAVVDVVDALETWDAVSIVKSELESFNVRLSGMEGAQPKINEKIDNLIDGMKELKEMIKPPKKPIDYDDPAFR